MNDLKDELTYVIVVILVLDVVVLVDECLQDTVLLHTKLKVETKVRITQNHFEATQTLLKKAENSTISNLITKLRNLQVNA